MPQGSKEEEDIANDNLSVEDYRAAVEDYREALEIQDACNLSGIVHDFSRVISKIKGLWGYSELP